MNDSSSASETTPVQSGSRRAFLARAAAVSIVPLGAGLLISRQRLGIQAGKASAPTVYQLDKFVPLIGSAFTVTAEGQPAYSLTLSKAEALKQHQPGVAERFSLRFTAPTEHPIESRIYQLQHPVLGSVDLFISPVGSSVRYGEMSKGEALINNLARPA